MQATSVGQKPMYVVPGDVVSIHIIIPPDKDERFEARILKVTPQYGRVNHGRDVMEPILEVVDLESGERHGVNSCFVTGIVRRTRRPQPAPENFFAHRRSLASDWEYNESLGTKRRGVKCGPLHVLAERALSTSHHHLPHPIDPVKLADLFLKQRPGFLGIAHLTGSIGGSRPAGDSLKAGDVGDVIWVRWSVFRNWAQRMGPRLCMTTGQRIVHDTAENIRYETQYERDVVDEMMRDAEAMYGDEPDEPHPVDPDEW